MVNSSENERDGRFCRKDLTGLKCPSIRFVGIISGVSFKTLLEDCPIQNSFLYGVCGSRKYRRIGRRATDVENGNAGPKLHCRLWEKSGFPALPRERDFLADNKGHDGGGWAERQLLLAYCL